MRRKFEDSVWDAGYRAGKEDGLEQADRLAFGLQELLLIANDDDADPEWALEQIVAFGDKHLTLYRKERNVERNTASR